MIHIQGTLTIQSADSTIRIQKDGAQLKCMINGWPKSFSPRNALHALIPEGIVHEPINVYYNNRKLGEVRNGKLTGIQLLTGVRAFIDYLRI